MNADDMSAAVGRLVYRRGRFGPTGRASVTVIRQ
jgi:hypothetical protein